MTDYRAPAEPYTWSFEAAVEEVAGREVVLDTTHFYAEGGGQPADRGTLAGVAVEDVQKRDGEVVHKLVEPPGVEVGETVQGEVDPDFRTYCMRAHTASHVLYGAGRRLLSDLGYGGFGITEEKVRVDFTTTSDVDDDTLAALERLVNRAVWESREVSWTVHPEAEALAMDEIAFNTKTEEGIAGDTVRVVTVGGPDVAGENSAGEPWDVAACGGTHVSNTREIGPVTVLDRSNPGEGLTRVEIAVGPPGIERRIAEKRAALDAAATAGVSVTDLPGEVSRLRDEIGDLEAEAASLRDRIAETQIEALRDEVVERDGVRWLVGEVEGLDANALGEHAKDLAGEAADVVALAGANGRAFLAVAAAGDADAGEVVDAVTGEFGGGGGGSPRFAQAGGIDADPGEIVAFLRG